MDPIDPSSLAMVERALDAAALRHAAIAHNIANVNSADYVPLGVSFQDELAAAGGGAAGAPRIVEQAGYAPGPRPQDLDVEMVKLSENTVHYQALLRAASLHFAILRDALGQGQQP